MSRLGGLWDRSRRWSWPLQVVMAVTVIVIATGVIGIVESGNGNDSTRQARSLPTSTSPVASATTTTVPITTSTVVPVTTTPSTTAPAAAGGLAQLVIAEPSHSDSYNRDLFGRSGWIDTDHDCQGTRAEILIVESRMPVTFTSAADCTVASGDWIDPWSRTENTSARALDIDHTVPLANAWRSGAWAWTPDRRLAYANDLTDAGQLIAIPLGENRSKGDDGPEAWKPPDHGAWCRYAQVWDAIKVRWKLTASPAEWSTLLTMAATC